jgi:triosephosphate isomerase
MKKVKKAFLIAGNWKMNPDSLAEAKDVFSAISRKAAKAPHTLVVIAPPAPFLTSLTGKKGGAVHISAQDVAAQPSGAFTGSISAKELKSSGAEYTIIGHSERRAAGDTDEIIAKKTKEAIAAGLRVILCVGETERDAHARYLQMVRAQMLTVFTAIDKKLLRWITIAYEPVWAIGKSYDTAPKPADIHEMSIYIKKVAAEILGKKDGMKVQVLYGGSVNAENAQNILREAEIDGLLVGRQSLDPEAFGTIIEYAESI